MTLTYGNRSLFHHVARGVVGFGSLYLAIVCYERIGWPAMGFFGLTLWMLKGCPVCWTIGLFETVAFKVLSRSDPL